MCVCVCVCVCASECPLAYVKSVRVCAHVHVNPYHVPVAQLIGIRGKHACMHARMQSCKHACTHTHTYTHMHTHAHTKTHIGTQAVIKEQRFQKALQKSAHTRTLILDQDPAHHSGHKLAPRYTPHFMLKLCQKNAHTHSTFHIQQAIVYTKHTHIHTH